MPSLSSFLPVENPLKSLDDEGGDAARARGAIGLGVDHKRVGDRAVGDPHFRAVENVAVAFAVGAGAHRHHVRTRARLRHCERADMLAGNEFRQITALLLVAAVPSDLVDAEVRMRAIGQADRGGGARNFFHRHAMGEIAEPRAAQFLLDGDAKQSQRAEFRPQLARETVGAVDLVGARRDLVRRSRAPFRAACRHRRRGRNRDRAGCSRARHPPAAAQNARAFETL